jgi:hypothetical protein
VGRKKNLYFLVPFIRLRKKKSEAQVGRLWVTPVILAIQEAEIRRIGDRSQPEQIVLETLTQKKLFTKKAGGVSQDVGLEFKLQYCKEKKKRRSK